MFPVSRFRGRFRTKTSVSLWTPAQLSTALWLDAADASTITLNGSNVSQWNDKSGNGRNASQTTAANQPPYNAIDSRANSKPSIGSASGSFLGFRHLRTTSIALQRIFIVTAYRDGTVSTWGSTATLVSGPGTLGTFRIMANTTGSNNSWLSSSSFASQSFVNGASTATSLALPMPLSIQRFDAASAITQDYGFGGNIGATDRVWDGPICEIVCFPDLTLSTEDIQRIEGYLAWKWETVASLPMSHPYKNSPPTV